MNKFFKSFSAHLLIATLCLGSFSALGVTPGTHAPASQAASSKVKLKKKSATIFIRQDGADITKDKTKIKVKKKKGVKIKKIRYECADTGVASVSKKGTVSPKTVGATTVSVKVKYRYKKKTKTKTLDYKVRVKKSYRHILSGLTLKYKTYATFVGGAEGINPCYDTRVSVDKEFFAWDCLTMKIDDPSVVEIGENGYIAGKKPGTATVTISSTDDTNLSVTATLKVFATRQELSEKNDLYNTVRAEYLPAVESGWTEEEKARYIDSEGRVQWSQQAKTGFQMEKNKEKIVETYEKAGKQPDNTPEDALNSILTTGQKMREGSDAAEEAFLQTVRDKVVAPIRAAGSIDELLAVSEDLEKRGLTGLVNLHGFFLYRDNNDYYADVMNGKLPMPTEPTDVSRVYMPNMSSAVSLAGYSVNSEQEKKNLLAGLLMQFKALGFEALTEKEAEDYIELLTDYSTTYYDPGYEEFQKPIKEVAEMYPNLRITEHLKKKGYTFSDTDPVAVAGVGGYKVLNDYLGDEKNLGVLKLYLAEAATYELLQYSRLSLRVSLKEDPELFEGDNEAEINRYIEEEYNKQLGSLVDLIPWDFDHIYTKTVYPKDYKTQFEKLVQAYEDSYREALASCEYGATFRSNMLKKINAFKVDCLYPDDATYKSFEIPYDLVTAGEGGNLAENLLKVRQYRADMECMTIGTAYGSIDWWYPQDTLFESLPNTYNAYYDFSNNRCVFFHGGIGLDCLFFYKEKPDEETEVKNLGYLATTVGHEMGHAFDRTGSRFDENGRLADLWGPDDPSAYNAKVEKLAQLYGSLVFYADMNEKKAYFQDGNNVVGEAMADLGGTEISLRIIRKKYPGRDDLIRRFYRCTAEQWMSTQYDDMPPYQVSGYIDDVHPLSRSRTNGVASMTDEYYRVFDISETDAMYVAPEDRVSLWGV